MTSIHRRRFQVITRLPHDTHKTNTPPSKKSDRKDNMSKHMIRWAKTRLMASVQTEALLKRRYIFFLLTFTVVAANFCVWFLFDKHTRFHTTDIPIVIPFIDFSVRGEMKDFGGYMRYHSTFSRWSAFSSKIDPMQINEPDFGGLDSNLFGKYLQVEQEINQNNTNILNRVRKKKSKKKKNEKPKKAPGDNSDKTEDSSDEIEDSSEDSKCEPPGWYESYQPNCNFFHDFDISRYSSSNHGFRQYENYEYDSMYSSYGYWRDTWILKYAFGKSQIEQEGMALKLLQYRHSVSSSISLIRHDALVMERLTASPRIMNLYGHCGTSIGVELVENEVEEFIVPGSGMISKSDLEDSQDVNPQNHFSSTEKLEIALTMAEGLADLHGFEDGIIVHADVQLCQWMRRSNDNKLILGDFNKMHVLFWDEVGNKYCKFNEGGGFSTYRSPEEFDAKDLDEKIDVFTFGNNIYALLTGLWVFYDNDDSEDVQDKLIDGKLAFIDDRYRHRSYAESQLVEIMEKCWIYDPSERIDIFEIVRRLRDAVRKNKKIEF